ncbi:hypothetical protein EV424DRAFT_1352749 [Suillus variegatus]|nr:hypothetical protein EV424DRAFT_1352749 [Suillus variegatus]
MTPQLSSDFQDDGRKNAAHSLFFSDNIPAPMVAISDYTSDASVVFEANTTYNVLVHWSMLRGNADPDWGWVDRRGQQPVAWNFGTAGSSNIYIFNNIIILTGSDNASCPFIRRDFRLQTPSCFSKTATSLTEMTDWLSSAAPRTSPGEMITAKDCTIYRVLIIRRFSVTWKDITLIDATFPIYVSQRTDRVRAPRPPRDSHWKLPVRSLCGRN